MCRGLDKGAQDVVHVLSHPYDPEDDYGFEFLTSGPLVIETLAAPGLLRRDVGAAISRLRRSQDALQFALDDTEKVSSVRRVIVEQQGSGLMYRVDLVMGRVDPVEVAKAFIITNQHQFVEGVG